MKAQNIPGTKAKKLLERDLKVISPSYPRAYPIEGGFMENAAEGGEYTLDALSEIMVRNTSIGQMSGKGLMLEDAIPSAEVEA